MLEYKVPRLNDADREHLTCSDFPDFNEVLRKLPDHQWLSTTRGEVVRTDGGHTWVRFDVVQEREARLILFAGVTAAGAHFECYDDLAWLAKVWTDLEADE